MQVTEVHLVDEHDLAERLTDIQTWLDNQRYEPSKFTYFFVPPGMKIRVSFEIDDQAKAFAQKFGGTLVDTARPTGELITA